MSTSKSLCRVQRWDAFSRPSGEHGDDLVLLAIEPLQASVRTLDEAAESVQQRSGAAGPVPLHGQVGNLLDGDSVVDDFEGVLAVELDEGQGALA